MTFHWDLGTTAYEYRPLRLATPRQEGWDVLALQTGLNGLGAEVQVDGVFGQVTKAAVSDYQLQYESLVDEEGKADGVAGVMTQTHIAQRTCRKVRRELDLPQGIPFGHAEHESSCWLGNHTRPYPDLSRDCGVVQRNTNYASPEAGFDVPDSILACGRQVKAYHEKYAKLSGLSDDGAWYWACGSWNAPAFTDALAAGKQFAIVGGVHIDLSPGSPVRHRIEAYCDATTIYWRRTT